MTNKRLDEGGPQDRVSDDLLAAALDHLARGFSLGAKEFAEAVSLTGRVLPHA